MDEDKKKPRGDRPRKPAGPQGRKPGSTRNAGAEGGKPFRAGGAKKPFQKREGNAGADKPRRPFKRAEGGSGAERPERSDKPFRSFAPRGDGKAFDKRPRRDGDDQGRGERREWKPREGARLTGSERPERSDRPFRSSAPRGDGKPFEKRPRRDGDGAGRGERREWKPREGAAAENGERREWKPREGLRSFGSKSHEGQRRSYGTKSHGDERAGFSGGKGPSFRKPGAAPVEDAGQERIAKRLARAGIASRRDAEELIAAGRVSVNGRKLDSPAFNVSANDLIHVDGTEIPAIERTRLFLFHKPAGVVTTNRDPEGRKTVFDALPEDLPRLMTIGRLDINTEGLLLLTNDGGLARVLELPATGWLRRYRVRVHGKVEEKALAGLKDGIAVDGVFYGAVEASMDRQQGTNAWLTIGLREGKNREVKNILGALGLDVTRLIRISYGPFQLNDLEEGHVLEIKGRMLREQLGERLVEESGANFEAGVINQFSNRPVRREEPKAEPLERPQIRRDGERGRIGEGGLIKKRRRREDERGEALGKLTTQPDAPKPEAGERSDRGPKFSDRPGRPAFGDKPGGKPAGRGRRGEREERPIEPPGQRKSNVWMASGARPIGKGRLAAEKAEAEARREARKPRGRPDGDRPRTAGRDFRKPSDGKGGPRGAGGKSGPKGPGGRGR